MIKKITKGLQVLWFSWLTYENNALLYTLSKKLRPSQPSWVINCPRRNNGITIHKIFSYFLPVLNTFLYFYFTILWKYNIIRYMNAVMKFRRLLIDKRIYDRVTPSFNKTGHFTLVSCICSWQDSYNEVQGTMSIDIGLLFCIKLCSLCVASRLSSCYY